MSVPDHPRNDEAVRRFVEDFASALAEMGVPRMPARVFVALLTSDSGRLTAAELAARLRASPAAMSGAVTSIERRRLRGTRGILQSVQTNCPPCEPVHIVPGAAMACSMHRRPTVDHSNRTISHRADT